MAALLIVLLQVIVVVFIGRIVFGWIRPKPDSPMYPTARLVHRVTEPVLSPIRRALPRTGRLDFSATVVLLVISFVLIPVVSRL